MSTTFAISYSPKLRWLFVGSGLGPARSRVVVTEEDVDVRFGWGFRAHIDRRAIVTAVPYTGRVTSWGAHGWRHRWLVNGSSQGIVMLTLDPVQRAWAVGVRLRVRELAISVDEPEAFMAAVGPHQSRG